MASQKTAKLTGLPPKKETFVHAYVTDAESATEAARRAGYQRPGRQSQRLLNDPDVRAEIEGYREEARQQVQDDATQVLRDLYKVSQTAMRKEDTQAALKAIELRGKYHGIWQKQNGGGLGDAEDILQRYKAARERAHKAQQAHQDGEDGGENVVEFPSAGGQTE